MGHGAEELRERCKVITVIKSRMEVCVTRIEVVDDVVREESKEQDEEVEFVEKEDHGASTILDCRVNKKELNTK